ncbi:Uu.00g138930.m01.CDS01 [Anthostomella pinea]|uniref:Uu.00g138930.m01.CDS01 n=1 Tax=Anthostomella pinea TaxID=933095 RepID=A0AAI8YL77_9PEZI|nr:Uu.00g138930.m01.CDS01 [Anthostomella pinea]
MDDDDDDDIPQAAGPLLVDGSAGEYVARGERRTKSPIWPLLALLLLVNLTTSIQNLPLNRLLERRLCRDYYGPDKDVSEELCKIDEIQQDLAWTIGCLETLWVLGDFAMTIPLGFLAEKYGRRAILWLNLVSRLFLLSWALIVGYLSLPPQALIAGSALSVLGGDTVFNSLVYVLAAKVTDDNVTRATYFSWMTALSSVINFLGPAVAAATMSLRLFLPFWLGIGLLILAIPTISLLPRVASTMLVADDENQRPLISSPTLKAQASNSTLLSPIVERVRTLVSVVRSHPRNLTLLLISFFLTSLASSDTKLLAQYISKRYQWTFASAGYLLSLKAVVNFVLLSIAVPFLLKARRSNTQSQSQSLSDRGNLRYSSLCLTVSVLGAIAISISGRVWMLFPSLLLYALGSPLPVFTLGLLKSPAVSPQDEGNPAGSTDPDAHIFSIVMMSKSLGSVLGAPLMATLWFYGIRTAIFGLPFFASTLVYLAAIAVFSGIKLG